MQEDLQKSNEFCSKTPQKSNERHDIGRSLVFSYLKEKVSP